MIVQDDLFDGTASITVCPLTSELVDAPLSRVAVKPSATAGIEQPSHIMVDKITTVPRENVRERIGQLTDVEVVYLNRALLVFLGLAG